MADVRDTWSCWQGTGPPLNLDVTGGKRDLRSRNRLQNPESEGSPSDPTGEEVLPVIETLSPQTAATRAHACRDVFPHKDVVYLHAKGGEVSLH